VAIDGPDAAGKTTFADRLARAVSVPICRASIDGFHAPRDVRRRRGALSPEGYYRDCFDYPAFGDRLLRPFLAGAAAVDTRIRDLSTDSEDVESVDVPPACILVVDGVFLLRPELRSEWTMSVHLHASDDVILERALVRDVRLFGSEAAVVERYRSRYLPGQSTYRREARPLETADVVVLNDDPQRPEVLRWSLPSECP
jgi:uridine kinase